MNHDATHCADWDEKICPSDCYRAELTEELEHRSDMWYLPMSYSHFKGTVECKLTNSMQTNADRIRAMGDEELMDAFMSGCSGRECPKCDYSDDFEVDTALEQCRQCWLDWLRETVGGAE